MGMQHKTLSRARGFGLVECAAALAVSGVLVAVALPSFRAQQLRSHRIEAPQSLQRIQLAQEQYRGEHGRYAEQLSQLPGAADTSPRGHYRIVLHSHGPQAYELVAQAVGEQLRDKDCTTLTLRIEGALSHQEPSARCWNA